MRRRQIPSRCIEASGSNLCFREIELRSITLTTIVAAMTATANAQPTRATTASALGPLVVSQANPRYFTVAPGHEGAGRAVYLTGSHIWNNLHDGMGPGTACAATPEPFDYDAYLTFLNERGNNFIRLWRWEQFKSQAAGGSYHLCMVPQPWPRTGPGTAKDGKPKFDLSKFDQTFFDRLRERVKAAGDAGIYVAVMLFDGWALHLSPPPDNVEGHPFHAANNVNGIGINSIVEYQVVPLNPRVRELQEAYIKKVVDAVQDLPNVLYEVANESSGGGSISKEFAEMMGFKEVPNWGNSTEWQYWVIDVVKNYEKEQRYTTHPIGMTMQFPVADQTKVNDPLFASRAEWVSPGYDDEMFAHGGHPMAPGSPPSRWYDNPPASDGKKIIITDTDHYAPGKGDALWAWKAFLRGQHPILMDFGLIGGVRPADPTAEAPGVPSFASMEPARYAMGDTRRYAERMNLIDMKPNAEISSTGYALVNPGREYLVLQPNESAAAFSVRLESGSYAAEWFDVKTRETTRAPAIKVERDGAQNVTPPFTGPAVLYLKRT